MSTQNGQQSLAKCLAEEYRQGIERSISSSFPGSSTQYLRERIWLWATFRYNDGVDGYFIQKDRQPVIDLVLTIGHLAFIINVIPGIICVLLYVLSEDVRKTAFIFEAFFPFANYFFFGLILIVREPVWSARDERTSYIMNGLLEHFALVYRESRFLKQSSR